ncbi:unnamed protein product [Strongylus vulgaris]|uniref:Uncharacterized protein n=1 Tax=Strongylus vulgaris TaxID=40348 RepID=A0A3P7J8K7_STRVU|nr:unnamed protein product [Strongylus vulgaris]
MTVYRPVVEIQSRIVGYGGKCIRGFSATLPNHPNCPEPDITFNKIRSVLIDEVFARSGCHHGHDWAIIELEERCRFFVCLQKFHIRNVLEMYSLFGRLLQKMEEAKNFSFEKYWQKETNLNLPSDGEEARNRTNRIQFARLNKRGINKRIEGITIKVSTWEDKGREMLKKVFNESGPMIHEIPMIVDPKCDRPRTDKLPSTASDYLCATSMNTDDYFAPRTCHGDSGAGMEQIDERGRSVLVALTSFGTKGCPANELARFTRVDHYLQPICAYTGVCYSLIGRDL